MHSQSCKRLLLVRALSHSDGTHDSPPHVIMPCQGTARYSTVDAAGGSALVSTYARRSRTERTDLESTE